MLRPDEMASQSIVESNKRSNQNVGSTLKTAANIATGVGAGAIASKIAPFLSEFVPFDLAMKGINKVSPQVGQMLQKGVESGLDPMEGLNFLKEHIQGSQQQIKDDRNLIQKYSPEIFQTLEWLIKQGLTPSEAALNMKSTEDSKVKKLISQMEKDYNQNWPSIVESVFGQSGVQKPAQQQQGGMSDQDLIAKLQQALSL